MSIFDDFKSAAERGSSLIKDPKLALNPTTIGPDSANESLPWKNQSDKFFGPNTIDKDRWDKIYPYRFLVINVEDGNRIVGGTSTADAIDVRVQIDSSSIVAEAVNKWEFRLPLTPEQISVTDQYAINTSATFRGILEEHNGVKFKMISAQGTTGLWANRPAYSVPTIGAGGVSSFLQSTLGAVQNLASSVSKTISTFTSGRPYNAPKAPEVPLDQTGYYQAELMGQFIEQYTIAKKNPANKGWRLVWDDSKRNQSFIVTPVNFALTKSAQRPGLHMWSFQLKAWRRVELSHTLQQLTPDVSRLDNDVYRRLLNGISNARLAVQDSLDLIKAVRSDFQRPLTILRQASLLLKDAAGLPQAVAELPNQIVSDYKSAIMENKALLDFIATNSTSKKIQENVCKLNKALTGNEGLSLKAVESGNLGTSRTQSTVSDPAFSVFSQPETSFELLTQVNLNELNLTDKQREAFEIEILAVRLKSVDDLKQERKELRDLALDIANKFGAGGSRAYDIYDRPAPTVRATAMTLEESEILERLWDAIQAFDTLTATTFLDTTKQLNPLQFVGNLAAANGIEFNSSSRSKVLVPVPFGLNIEQVAQRYLGDRNRYIEIATLNNLRDPYIDQDGFQRLLLSNGQGRQITVSDATNLYVGQKVVLRSRVVTAFTRNITAIETISEGTILLTFDGVPNLDSLLLVDTALIQAYLPGTVNSQDQIYIPTDLPSDPDDGIKLPNGVLADSIVGLSKVDFLLTDDMDVAINSYGEFRYAAGMTNLVQALKIKFSTERGSLMSHPEFGLGIKPGSMNSDLEIKELYKQIDTMIKADSRFAGVGTMQIRLNGPALEISVLVRLRNLTGVIPITFVVNAATGAPV